MRISDWSSDVCSSDLLDPQLVVRKFLAFGRLDAASRKAEEFVALEDWLNDGVPLAAPVARECLGRSEEHTSELQSLMRISYAVFCLKKKNTTYKTVRICRYIRHWNI